MYVCNKLGESFLDSLSVKLSFIRLFGNFSQCQVIICYIFKYLLVRAIITTVSANNKITSMLNVTGSAKTYHLSANYT